MCRDGGWLAGLEIVESPNADARPADAEVSLLVVHNISLPPGCFGTGAVRQLFCNMLDFDADPFYQTIRGVRVSAHFFIERNGRTTQFVPTVKRAWHAGVSQYFGRVRVNDFSLGVELEGTDEGGFTDAQYGALVALTDVLMSHCPLVAIAGHSDVAPGRKTDPGPSFDWPRFRRASGLPPVFFPYRWQWTERA